MCIEGVKIELSKRGIPCVWEQGGAYTSKGSATLVCDKYGNPKKPLYIKTKGSLACGEHALIPIRIGDYIIECVQHRKDFDIEINKIKGISEDVAILEIVNSFSENQWDVDLKDKFENVIKAAKDKSTSYHCRCPYFIKEENAYQGRKNNE